MNVTIICEETTRKKEYIEHIINNCIGVEHLPMKLVLSSEEVTGGVGLSTESIGESSKENLVIEESSGFVNEIIEMRELKVDVPAKRVWVRGEEQHFTRTEFEILTFLARRSNRVVTKEELCKAVFGASWSEARHRATLTVHMKNIRMKLEVDHKNPSYIETIWGQGYRLNE